MKIQNRTWRLWICILWTGLAVSALVGCPPYDECLECGDFEVVGAFSTPEIVECSGLVASKINPGILWTHNDSHGRARIFAVKEDGSLRGIYTLQGANTVDWEDIAWGPCSAQRDADCLYIGDIGDNSEHRDEIQVYRVPEPSVPMEGPPVEETLQEVERFDCRYPNRPHNAETLLVDPEWGIPYIVPRAGPLETVVYRFPAPPVSGETVTLEKVALLAPQSYLKGGDVSPDGSRVILRDYYTGFEYPRPDGGTFDDIFSQIPCQIPLAEEAQGEALAIGIQGREIYTASEGQWAPIHRVICTLP